MKIVELETPNSCGSNHKNIEMRGDAPPTSTTKHCNCKESKCLKLYCNCFSRKEICTSACSCENCGNTVANFVSVEEGTTVKVCNCKKSFCAKKYCECFQAGFGCSNDCKCIDCENPNGARKTTFESGNRQEQSTIPPSTSNLSFQSPFNATPLNSVPAMKSFKNGRPSGTSFQIMFTQRGDQQDQTTIPNTLSSSYQAPLCIMPIQSVPGDTSCLNMGRHEAGFNITPNQSVSPNTSFPNTGRAEAGFNIMPNQSVTANTSLPNVGRPEAVFNIMPDQSVSANTSYPNTTKPEAGFNIMPNQSVPANTSLPNVGRPEAVFNIMPDQSVSANNSYPNMTKPEAGFIFGIQKEKLTEVKVEKRPYSPEPEEYQRKRKSQDKYVDSSSIHTRLCEIRTLLEAQLEAQNATNNLISKLTDAVSDLNNKL